MSLEPQAALAITAAAGMLYCFLGYRLFKLVLGLTGFVLAGVVAMALVGWLARGNEIAMLAALFIGGLCGALALFFLYRAGVFCLGFLAALLLGYQLLHLRPEAWAPWAIVGVALAGGLFALLVERPAMTLATSAIGAWLCATAAAILIWGDHAAPNWSEPASLEDLHWELVAGWAVLTLVGTGFQLRTTKKKKREEPPA